MDEVCGGASHAPRLASLTDGVAGVLQAASLGGRALGQGLAVAQGLARRHASKHVDRWLSPPKRSMEQVCGGWGPCVVGERRESFINCDWTACEDADQGTVVRGRHTEPGRRPPRVWQTVTRSALKEQRHDHADALLVGCAAVVPQHVRGTGGAERGCSDRQLSRFLTAVVGCDSSSRCRGNVDGEDAAGEPRKAKEGLGTAGRRRVFRPARITAQRPLVPVGVGGQDKALQEPWCLGSSRQDRKGVARQGAYGRRFTGEETCRDVKHPRFGLGRKQVSIERHDRRDARCLLAVLAHTLRTWLGQAGQDLGMDRRLGATRPSQRSCFRQGLMLFELIPKMRAARLRALAKKFGELLQEQVLFPGILGVI